MYLVKVERHNGEKFTKTYQYKSGVVNLFKSERNLMTFKENKYIPALKSFKVSTFKLIDITEYVKD